MTSRFSHNFWSEWLENHSGIFENSEFQSINEKSSSDLDLPEERFQFQEELVSPAPAGCQLYLPEKYEHNYAYPLMIWLHGEGNTENDLLSVMPQITDQNFLGLSFRGNKPSQNSKRGRTWDFSAWEMDRFEERLYDTVCELRKEYHIHSERIYLAGFDSGAKVALNLIQNRPDWFGGALLFGGRLFNKPNQVLESVKGTQGKRILLGIGSDDHPEVMADHAAAVPFLKGSGMEVSTRIYEAGHEMTREMYRDINFWIMDAVCSPATI